jgi:hypothetical protein
MKFAYTLTDRRYSSLTFRFPYTQKAKIKKFVLATGGQRQDQQPFKGGLTKLKSSPLIKKNRGDDTAL